MNDDTVDYTEKFNELYNEDAEMEARVFRRGAILIALLGLFILLWIAIEGFWLHEMAIF